MVLKQLKFVGSSLDDLKEFPSKVRRDVGHALHQVQTGIKPKDAKPLKGFLGAGVLEIVENYHGTYRAVYTVKFDEVIYVLHCFQKKSKSGIKTPQHEMDLIRQRLKIAEEKHKFWRWQ